MRGENTFLKTFGMLLAGLVVLGYSFSIPLPLNARQNGTKPCRGKNCQSPAPTASLSAQPTSIVLGQSSTLSWSSQNASSLDLEPGIGTVAAQGSIAVSPQQTTTYTLTATGSGGTTTASATVTIDPGTVLNPADDIQAAVNASPAGTTFILNPGLYRMQSVVPKDGDIFAGESGAVLDGAILVSSWRGGPTVWTAQVNGIIQEASYRGVCDASHPACMYPEDLFFDSQPLVRVGSVSLVKPGAWYFDYSTGTLYAGSDPTGHVTEMSALHAAFWGDATNVTIKGLTIEKYASIAGKGAINAMASLTGYGPLGPNWVVDSDELMLNHGMGVRIADGMVVSNCKIHDNGQLGLGGNGNGILIQNNEIYKNNYAGYDFSWEAGGAKVASYATNVIFDGNYVHDNKGPGLHADVGDDYVTFENNHTARNVGSGIHYEISYHGVIKNNLIEDDGFSPLGTSFWYGGGILVSNSSDVEVYGNTVTDCMNGIGGTQTDRGIDSKTGLPYTLKNLYVHDNTITQQVNFAAGIVKGSTFDDSVYTSWGNHFQNNTYNLTDLSHPYFVWLDQLWTYAQWQEYSSEH